MVQQDYFLIYIQQNFRSFSKIFSCYNDFSYYAFYNEICENRLYENL